MVAAAIAAMLVLDRDRPAPEVDASTSGQVIAAGLPVAGPASALSSTWYCAGGTGEPGEEAFALHTVVVANPSDEALEGRMTVYGGRVREAVSGEEQLDEVEAGSTTTTTTEPADDGDDTTTTTAEPPPEPVVEQLSVPARSRVEVLLSDVVEAPLVSAVVELPGGAGVVEHVVESVNGRDAAPCASDAAEEWHFAWGVTTADARELLVFFNPFPDDAVIDGSFITDDGPREPGRFDGLVVPAGSVVGLDLGDDVTIRNQIAGSLRTRSGRVIVDRIQRFDGSGSFPKGLTVGLGMPVAKPLWIFPDGLVDDGVRERFHVYNPTDRSAQVVVEITPDDPVENGIPEPFELSVQPGATATIDVTEDGRVADGVAHSATLRVLNDSAVVAERVLIARSPANRSGVSATSGSPVASPRWIFAAGGTTSAQDEFLYLVNPSNEFLATVKVTALANGQPLVIDGLAELELPAAGRLSIRLGDRIEREDLALVVEASVPIVAERGLYAAEGPGVSNALGIPDLEALIEPPPFITDDPDGG